ncbi:hypothetical protein TRFO_09687 [Tritrichomonas foetus]|uniref:Adenylate and Guanylate cyclase catalytic domain containing protein n=1 Tax=Tritrichomonas foetus TaxID=1144522 RepID=A0A1J4JEM5_9EUKA|nr:hypothetical protein TRFO_09687 [Tritrichomonas foetus]|eukprot:OHS97113.1 hypothetical protein TRFO_09687 [Tritrichomonas foetus]
MNEDFSASSSSSHKLFSMHKNGISSSLFELCELLAKSFYMHFAPIIIFALISMQMITCTFPYVEYNAFMQWVFKILIATDTTLVYTSTIMIIIVVLTILIFVYFMVGFIYCYRKLRLSKCYVIVLRIIVDIIAPIIVYPSAGNLSVYLLFLLKEGKNTAVKDYVLEICLFLCFIFQLFLTWISFVILANSIYHVAHFLDCISQNTTYVCTFTGCFIIIFETFFYFFPDWTLKMFFVFETIVIVIIYVLHFVNAVVNPVVAGIQSGMAISFFFSRIVIIVTGTISIFWFIATYLLFLISGVISSLLNKNWQYKRSLEMSYDGVSNNIDKDMNQRGFMTSNSLKSTRSTLVASNINSYTKKNNCLKSGSNRKMNPNSERKKIYNDQNKNLINGNSNFIQDEVEEIEFSERHAFLLLNIGLIYGADKFLDFSIVLKIVDFYPTKLIIKTVIKSVIGLPNSRMYIKKLFNIFSKLPDLSFIDHFFLFQLRKNEMMHQTGSSSSLSDESIEVKNIYSQSFDRIQQTWLQSSVSLNDLEDISAMAKKGEIIIKDFMTKYPNYLNGKYIYLNFSTEISTNFEESIRMINHILVLENNHYFRTDSCFKHLVWALPKYVKKHILTVDGNWYDSKKRDTAESSIIYNTNSVNFEESEGYFYQKITFPKIRMAIYQFTENIRANSYIKIMLFRNLFCLFAILFLIGILAVLNNLFPVRENSMPILDLMLDARSNFTLSFFTILIKFFTENGDKLEFWKNYNNLNSRQPTHISNNLKRLDYVADDYALKSLNGFQQMMTAFTSLESEGVYAYSVSNVFFEDKVRNNICQNSKIIATTYSNIKEVITMDLNQMLILATIDMKDFLTNPYLCAVTSSFSDLTDNFFNISLNIYSAYIEKSAFKEKLLYIMSILLPVVYVLAGEFGVIYFHVLYLTELKEFASILSHIKNEIKSKALSPIMKQSKNETKMTQSTKERPSYLKYITLLIIEIALVSISGAFIFIMTNTGENMSGRDMMINYWSQYNSNRIIFAVNGLSNAVFAAILNVYNEQKVHFTTYELIAEKAIESVQSLDLVSQKMIDKNVGDKYTILGVHEDFDNFYLNNHCDITEIRNLTNTEKLYLCKSVDTQLHFFSQGINDISLKIISNTVDDHTKELIANMYNLLISYLMPNLYQINTIIFSMSSVFLHDYQNSLMWSFIGGEISVILLFLALLINIYFFEIIYKGGIILIRHLPPDTMLENRDLLKFLLLRDHGVKEEEMTVTQSIMYHSNDIIFYVTLDGIIDGVNQAITEVLGYSKDQLLGKNVESLFNEETKNEVHKQISQLASGEQNSLVRIDANCLTANNKTKFFTLTLFRSTVIVAILTDKTDLHIQCELAEKAKEKSEALLYHIIPPFIVRLLNQGNRSISISVPMASICFVDIAEFSKFTANLSPQEILGTLSIICEKYDSQLEKYETMTKIKMIGDTYMCAGGLFDNEMDPKKHANETIHFAFDALAVIEDVNFKMNIDLGIRIGINTGGPLIAGVLGTDKLAFDIIGDPINVAARLQSSGTVGKIHISEMTYSLIQHSLFRIEKRDKTFLKGKGTVTTYMVSNED